MVRWKCYGVKHFKESVIFLLLSGKSKYSILFLIIVAFLYKIALSSQVQNFHSHQPQTCATFTWYVLSDNTLSVTYFWPITVAAPSKI
jgi:hypothetical protein